MGLYEQIKDIAKNKGYSVNRLEKELGFARSSINKFNKNAPSADKLRKIADFLGVSVDYLMAGKKAEDKYDRFTTKEDRDIARKLDDLIEDINSKSDTYYNGERIDERSLKLLNDMLLSVKRQVEIIKENKKTDKR